MPTVEIDWTVTVECWGCDAPTHIDDTVRMACEPGRLCEACADAHYCADCRGE